MQCSMLRMSFLAHVQFRQTEAIVREDAGAAARGLPCWLREGCSTSHFLYIPYFEAIEDVLLRTGI